MEVDPSTLFRWVQRYAPEFEKRVRAYQGYSSTSWRVDETYIRVGGKWKYLFRAVDKHGMLIDFLLLDRRNTRAAHRFPEPSSDHDAELATDLPSPRTIALLLLGRSNSSSVTVKSQET